MIIFSQAARVTVETCACCCTAQWRLLLCLRIHPGHGGANSLSHSRTHTHTQSTEDVIKRIANVHTSLCNLCFNTAPLCRRFLDTMCKHSLIFYNCFL